MSFDISALLLIVRRWWWLLLLAPLAGGGAMYFYSKSQQPMYRATSVVWLQMAPGTDGADPSVIQEDINLAEMYRYLVTVEPVLDPVIKDLGLPYNLDTLREHITVSVVRATPLLEVAAADADPSRAAEIADGVAAQFSASIAELGMQNLAATTPNLAISTGTTMTARVLPAEVPQEPFAPRMKLFVLLGAALGVLVAAGGIALAEYLRRYYKPLAKPAALPDAPSLASRSYRGS